MEAVATPTRDNYNPHPDTPHTEIGRFFSRKASGLFSLREDGSLWLKRLDHGWKMTRAAPPPEAMAARLDNFKSMADSGKFWQRQVEDIPRLEELEHQLLDSCSCDTPTGHTVEPDGTGPDGVPSWLMVFGLI